IGSLINILCCLFFMLFVPVYFVGVLVCCIQNLIVLFGPKGPRGMSISEQQYSVACLFFVLLPVVLYVYEPAGVGLFFASMIFWFVLRQVQQSSMFAGKTFLPAACVLLLCMGGALFIPPVVHPWNARKEAADMDYRAMEAIFQGKLPASFKIVKTHYPGFSRIFNGPDGPGEPYYLVTVEKQEYAELMSRVKKEEIPSSDFQRHAHSPMRMATAFDLDPIKDHLDKMRMYTLPKTTVVVDEISTPTRLYISTIVPYTKDVRDGFKASGLAK
ncbi:TPA: hypothetical protein DDW35_10710, partial [Candidatus Sumerlaeota bacterium]|nr:hypothetical protein [Candidatus Sumerlaeota bacterium]